MALGAAPDGVVRLVLPRVPLLVAIGVAVLAGLSVRRATITPSAAVLAAVGALVIHC